MEINDFPAAWPKTTRRLVNVRVNELVGAHSEAATWARALLIGRVLRFQNEAARHPGDDEVEAFLAGVHFTDLLGDHVGRVVSATPRPSSNGLATA